MKTYQQCQDAVERQIAEVTTPRAELNQTERLAFLVGFLKCAVIDLQFENEQLRSKKNEAEMHQLHERLSANKYQETEP